MPPLAVDPTKNVCPCYDNEDHQFVRVAIIASHAGEPPLTAEEAIAKLQNAWKKANNRKVLQWNEQLAVEQQRQEDEARHLEEEIAQMSKLGGWPGLRGHVSRSPS